MATFETITRVLAVASAAYPNFDLKPETVRVYLKLLADLPDELLEEASLAHIAQSAFFPTIAELRTSAGEILDRRHPVPTGLEAWSEVEDQIRDVGYTGQPRFAHPLTEILVNSMGWRNLCHSENLVADRAHFLAAYEQIRLRERNPMRLPALETRHPAEIQTSHHKNLTEEIHVA